MKVQKVTDSSFSKYGKVLSGYGFEKLLDTLRECSEKPSCGTIYVPSDETLEACEVYAELRDRAYGGMPIQIGYCNGSNHRLNCLEYHRDSEVDIATGRAAGMKTIGVSWGFRGRDALAEAGAVHVVDSPEEILNLIT